METVCSTRSEPALRLVRDNFKDTGILALIMLGINIAWPIVMIPLFILVFPGQSAAWRRHGGSRGWTDRRVCAEPEHGGLDLDDCPPVCSCSS